MTTEDLRVLLGGLQAMDTDCGIISLSVGQTGWAVERARRWISRDPVLNALTDLDIVWLLTRGWCVPRTATRQA